MIAVNNFLVRHKDKLFVFFILFLAAVFRFYRLDFQSLWLDELYTMKEASPSISWRETLDLVLAYEGNPPLFFFLEKIIMSVFGHTAFVARSLSALAGIAGVYAMFLLARCLFNKNAGYIAAFLTCFNWFHIQYSQEARGYCFLFLFTVLSVLGVVNFLKTPGWKKACLAALYSVLLINFHPYGVFVLLALVLVIVFNFIGVEDKMAFLKSCVPALLVFVVGAIPLFSKFREAADVTTSWITMPASEYFVGYFKEYFGSSPFLVPIFCVVILYYLFCVFSEEGSTMNFKEGTLRSGFVLILLWLVMVYFFTYVRSALSTPMLVQRYTIVGLPAYLLMLAGGLSLIKGAWPRGLMVTVILIISFVNMNSLREFYWRPYKTQFKEVTQFVKDAGKDYPVYLSERTYWQHSYYTERAGFKVVFPYTDKEELVDGIIQNVANGKQEGFWMLGAHMEQWLSKEKREALDSLFLLTQVYYLDAWAICCSPKKKETNTLVKKILPKDFKPEYVETKDQESVVTFWGNEFRESKPIQLTAGDYTLKIVSRGTPLENVFPHLEVYSDEQLVGRITNEYTYAPSEGLKLSVKQDTTITLRIRMDNDASNGKTGEDRNSFIKSVLIFQ